MNEPPMLRLARAYNFAAARHVDYGREQRHPALSR